LRTSIKNKKKKRDKKMKTGSRQGKRKAIEKK